VLPASYLTTGGLLLLDNDFTDLARRAVVTMGLRDDYPRLPLDVGALHQTIVAVSRVGLSSGLPGGRSVDRFRDIQDLAGSPTASPATRTNDSVETQPRQGKNDVCWTKGTSHCRLADDTAPGSVTHLPWVVRTSVA
jgi:hypothetical protein